MTKEELDLLSLRVKLFASAREAVGRDEVRVSLTENITADKLKKKIIEANPILSKIMFVLAVNHKVVDDSTVVTHMDEVAVLPPVSGG